MPDAVFDDPRLVGLYDAENPWGPDDDFFAAVAAETPGTRVVDLGCGTGRLTTALAAAGHAVTGVDPAAASLDVARGKPYADRVTWVHGTSADLPDAAFDLAFMTSHVAQVFVGDGEWAMVLADLARALVPGGRLAFDTRDPDARGWEQWAGERRLTLPDGGVVDARTEVTSVRDGLVSFTRWFALPGGDEVASGSTLRFRPEAEVRASLAAAGFRANRLYGGWHGEPVGAGAGELVVVASR